MQEDNISISRRANSCIFKNKIKFQKKFIVINFYYYITNINISFIVSFIRRLYFRKK